MSNKDKPKLRSQIWFDNPNNRKMTASYIERYPVSYTHLTLPTIYSV